MKLQSDNPIPLNSDFVAGQRLSADLSSIPTAEGPLANEHERAVDEFFAHEAFSDIHML